MRKTFLCLLLIGSLMSGLAQCWQFVSAGSYRSVGLKTNGSMWVWGLNADGRLGDGTYIDRNVPVQIGINAYWKWVNTGSFHTFAIKADGTLWAWGENFLGQLGDGSTQDRIVPTQIGTATDWRYVVANSYSSLGIKTDGTLWAWGYNDSGQLGDGTTTGKNTPTQVGVSTDWKYVALGFYHALGLKTDGTLWAWGRNDVGQLGDGTWSNKLIPTQIGTATDWKAIDAGSDDFSIALKTDGSMMAWGRNTFGQLGNGNNVHQNVPVQAGQVQTGNLFLLVLSMCWPLKPMAVCGHGGITAQANWVMAPQWIAISLCTLQQRQTVNSRMQDTVIAW